MFARLLTWLAYQCCSCCYPCPTRCTSDEHHITSSFVGKDNWTHWWHWALSRLDKVARRWLYTVRISWTRGRKIIHLIVHYSCHSWTDFGTKAIGKKTKIKRDQERKIAVRHMLRTSQISLINLLVWIIELSKPYLYWDVFPSESYILNWI